jgi:acyl carrier protein
MFTRAVGCPAEDVRPGARLGYDLGIDNFTGNRRLFRAVEIRHDIDIPAEVEERLLTVGDVADYLEALGKGKDVYARPGDPRYDLDAVCGVLETMVRLEIIPPNQNLEIDGAVDPRLVELVYCLELRLGVEASDEGVERLRRVGSVPELLRNAAEVSP